MTSPPGAGTGIRAVEGEHESSQSLLSPVRFRRGVGIRVSQLHLKDGDSVDSTGVDNTARHQTSPFGRDSSAVEGCRYVRASWHFRLESRPVSCAQHVLTLEIGSRLYAAAEIMDQPEVSFRFLTSKPSVLWTTRRCRGLDLAGQLSPFSLERAARGVRQGDESVVAVCRAANSRKGRTRSLARRSANPLSPYFIGRVAGITVPTTSQAASPASGLTTPAG